MWPPSLMRNPGNHCFTNEELDSLLEQLDRSAVTRSMPLPDFKLKVKAFSGLRDHSRFLPL